MKVLWICNTIFPEVAEYLGIEKIVFGGWMYSLSEELAKDSTIDLSIATIYNVENFTSVRLNNINFFLIPNNYKKFNNKYWNNLIKEFNPDIVHIHGTEYDYGMSLMETLPDLTYVVSVQGLVSVYSRYFFYGMNYLDVLSCVTLRDILKKDTIFHMKANFEKRGEIEKKYMIRADAIIGRTLWDKSCVKSINLTSNYYFCNEILRNEFYTEKKWSLANCNRYSIFLSQASYSYKGLHQVIRALGLISNKYPQARIEIAGPNILNDENLYAKLKRSGYGKYIHRLCQDLGLINKIKFLGFLNAEQMRDAYLRANVFVSASSIENGGNSVGEAQILGLPIIASYVGGVITTLETSKSALFYEFESYEMLSNHLDTVFSQTLFEHQQFEINEAKRRHSKENNTNQQINIYKEIIKKTHKQNKKITNGASLDKLT